MFSREPIWAALFAKLQTIPGLVTSERRLRHWNDVKDFEQPYLGLCTGGEAPSYSTGRTTQYNLKGAIWIYGYSGFGVPSQIVNPLLDGLTTCFAFDNTMQNAYTIGGLVMWARMGESETDEGLLGPQSVVRIPVEMLVMG